MTILNARLQGPAKAPLPKTIIPFITTYHGNYDNSNIIDITRSLINNSKNPRIQKVFGDVKFVHARRQPPNILRQITSAKFINTSTKKEESGIFCCKRSNCKLCRLYLQECKYFSTMKGKWVVKCHVICNSKNVIYFQRCNFCNYECNIGKAENIRLRQNNHMSSCRNGTGTDLFDKHV